MVTADNFAKIRIPPGIFFRSGVLKVSKRFLEIFLAEFVDCTVLDSFLKINEILKTALYKETIGDCLC